MLLVVSVSIDCTIVRVFFFLRFLKLVHVASAHWPSCLVDVLSRLSLSFILFSVCLISSHLIPSHLISDTWGFVSTFSPGDAFERSSLRYTASVPPRAKTPDILRPSSLPTASPLRDVASFDTLHDRSVFAPIKHNIKQSPRRSPRGGE